jgi:aspartate kinase
MGLPAISLTGWQAGFLTNRSYGSARIKNLNAERIEAELAKRRIVIVAGFQGLNRNDDITTLGRGGSDTSAVAIAATLKADRCQIYTDVDGVYTADPRLVPGAKKLSVISFDEMLELATLGAQVLNNRSVELAKKYGVEMEVLSSISKKSGTIVKEAVNMNEGMLIQGVAKDTKVAVITLFDVPNEPGISFKVFSLVSQKKINVDIILQASGRDGNKDLIFTVPEANAEEVRNLLNENMPRFGASRVEIATNMAKVSIVGAGMQSHSGVASRMFEALYEANINIAMVSTSEIKISVIIDKANADKAVSVIHAAFLEQEGK